MSNPLSPKTFEESLIPGLREFADRLLQFIAVEHHFVEGSLVIGLNSPYGSGKTTFLTMLRNKLKTGGTALGDTIVVSLNAWESDYFGDPLFAIVSALVDQIREVSSKEPDQIVSAAKKIGRYGIAIGSHLLAKGTGIDALKVQKEVEEMELKSASNPSSPADAFSLYQARKSAMVTLRDELRKYVNTSAAKILFLVDELDRCRPDYAISYLETIKHIFDLPGATFILAADRHHLCNSAKTAFGQGLNFDEYYRKFVQREIHLPMATERGFKSFVYRYIPIFLNQKGIRETVFPLDRTRIESISELAISMKLTPRQMQEVFRILGHFSSTNEHGGQLPWCFAQGSILMTSLKLAKPDHYIQLGNSQLDLNHAIQLVQNELKLDNVEWWMLLLTTGGGVSIPEEVTIPQALEKAGIKTECRLSHDWESGWVHNGKNGFHNIYRRIEEIFDWGLNL